MYINVLYKIIKKKRVLQMLKKHFLNFNYNSKVTSNSELKIFLEVGYGDIESKVADISLCCYKYTKFEPF